MIKRYSSTLLVILAFSTGSFALGFEWLRTNPVQYNQNPSMSTYTTCTSPIGKVYAGRLDSMIFYFGTMYGRQNIDCYDASGQLQWTYVLGQKAIIQCMAADGNGNLFAGGIFLDNLQVGASDSLVNTGPSLTINSFLISLDSTGTLRWERNVSLNHSFAERITAIHLDHQGNCWYGVSDFDTSFVIRLDNQGQDNLTRTIGGTRSLGGFDFDPQDNLFVSGGTEGGFTLSAGGISANVNDSYMMFVLRINAAGQGSWIRLAHDVTFQEPQVVCDPWGGAFIGGGLMDSTTWGSVVIDGPQWVYDIFLTKVDSTGNFSWGVEVPHTPSITGDFQRGDNFFMDADVSGNVYLTGITRGIVDWGNGVISGGGTPVYSSISFLSFDASGAPRWSLQGHNENFSGTYAVAVGSQGECYFAAIVRDTATFDTLTVNTSTLTFVLGKINTAITSSISTIDQNQFLVYPNPATDKIKVEGASNNSFFELYDVTGSLVKKGTVHSSDFELDVHALKSGMYFLTTGDKNHLQHQKIVKE